MRQYKWKLLLIFSALFYFSGQAQITLRGVVKSDSGELLPDARVFIPSIKIATGTDLDGKFELLVPAQRLRLSVSFIGYQTKWISLSPEMADDQNIIELKVLLESSINGLPEAVVSSQRRVTVIENFHTAVLDFDFLQNELLVLVSERRKYFLKTYSDDGESLLSMPLDKKPERLYRDCFGGLHLKYKYHVDELAIINEKIIILARHSIKEFKDFLRPCAAANEQFIVMEDKEDYDLSIRYTMARRSDGEKLVLREIKDQKSVDAVEAEAAEIAELEEELESGSAENPLAELKLKREIEQKKNFLEIILSQPAYYPCFRVKDSLIIFDHFSNEALLFNSRGKETRSIAIDHHLRRDWGSRIFQDIETLELYLVFVKSGVITLNLFNSESGEYTPVWRIEDHAYPEKLKIVRGKIWYVHQFVDQPAPALYSIQMSMD